MEGATITKRPSSAGWCSSLYAIENYVFSLLLVDLKLLSRSVDGKLFQIDGLWNVKLRCPVDVLTLGDWIHRDRVDADRSCGRPRTSSTGTRTHRVPADTQEQHHGHISTQIERSWRRLANVLVASGDCVELVTYGHSVELLTLTEPQCSGLIVDVSTDYLLLLPITV